MIIYGKLCMLSHFELMNYPPASIFTERLLGGTEYNRLSHAHDLMKTVGPQMESYQG